MPGEPAPVSAPVRLVIADDHPIFREGLKKLLESELGFSVVGEAADGEAAIQATKTLDPDVLLLDMAMPRMGGLETLPGLEGLRTRVIILTAAISESAILRAIQLGARGVVLKEVATRQLLTDIGRVMRGEYVVGEEVMGNLVGALRRPDVAQSSRRFSLTPRESEIVAAVVGGRSNKDIAVHLSISVQTVKHHLTSIFDKTGVSSRLELALFAVRHGLAGRD